MVSIVLIGYTYHTYRIDSSWRTTWSCNHCLKTWAQTKVSLSTLELIRHGLLLDETFLLLLRFGGFVFGSLRVKGLLHELLEGLKSTLVQWRAILLSRSTEVVIWSVFNHAVVVFTRLRASKISRCAAWMVGKSTDKGVLTLLVGDTEAELEMIVDLAKKVLELGLVNEDERFGVVVDVPDEVTAVKVSVRLAYQVTTTYRSHSRAQNLPWSKKADAISCEWLLLQNL
jgi:hypothetical protein